MTDEAKRRKIKQLRALADSTTFPAEAASARAKADKLEGQLPPESKRSPFAGPENVPSPWGGVNMYAAEAFTQEDFSEVLRRFNEAMGR